MSVIQVLIGIQARSTSVRLPGKCFEMIGNKRVLDYVIDSCNKSAFYLNEKLAKHGIFARVALLIPEGDKIESEFTKIDIIKGPEHDVLSRYMEASYKYQPTYIVRVTGDCPLLPSQIISKLVRIAIINKYDYVTNADEKVRTAIDGYDCEVISSKMLDYLHKFAVSASDREHVTTLARREKPRWANMGTMLDLYNMFEDIKLSVDTQEDLERIKAKYDDRERKYKLACEIYGKAHVHTF